MSHDEDGRFEPTRFSWIYDGLLVAGELKDWARMWEADYYACDVPPPTLLITWNGHPDSVLYWRVSVVQGKTTENDYMPYTITVPGLHDIAIVTIDGRA